MGRGQVSAWSDGGIEGIEFPALDGTSNEDINQEKVPGLGKDGSVTMSPVVL